MTEELSSNGSSEYLDFSINEQPDGEDVDQPDGAELEWEHRQEDIELTPEHCPTRRPYVFSEDPDLEERYRVWPPRNLSSEFEASLEATPVPRYHSSTRGDVLDEVVPEEQEVGDVFDSENEPLADADSSDIITEEEGSDTETVAMPTKPTAEGLAQKFNEQHEDWKREYDLVIDADEIADILYEEFTENFKAMRETYKQLAKLVGASFDADYPEIKENVKTLSKDILVLQRINEKNAPAQPDAPANNAPLQTEAAVVDPDTVVTEQIEELAVWYTVNKKEMKTLHDDLTAKLTSADGQPIEINDMLTMAVQSSVKSLEDIKKSAHDVQLKISQKIIKYSTQVLKTAALNKLDLNVQAVKRDYETISTLAVGYLSRVPAPTAPAPAQLLAPQAPPPPAPNPAIPRLPSVPMPEFDGRKTDYLFFKEVFTRQAKYPTEGDKVLALKKSLLLDKDKLRISKERTLANCWVKLDAVYGDATTLAAECTSIITSQPAPHNDRQFVEFMEKVEDCVSTLESLNISATYLPTLVLVVEKKLSKRMKDDLSFQIVKEKPDAVAKPKFVLDYLATEKAAANLRKSQYDAPPSKKDKDDDVEPESKSSKTEVTSGGRGRGRDSRGGSGRGRGEVKKSGQQEPRSDWSRGGGRGRGRGGGQRGGRPGRGGRAGRASNNGQCMVCGDDHMTSKCTNWSNLDTSKYELWCLATQGLAERLCVYCLEPGHRDKNCTSVEELGCPCGSQINSYICIKTPECVSRVNWNQTNASTATASANSTFVNGARIGATLSPIIKVKLSNSSIVLTSLFDNCSQTTFVLNSVAQKLNLKGKRISFVLICTDGSRNKKIGFMYKISLRDMFGNSHQIEAIGLEQISSRYCGAKITDVKRVLQHNPKCRLLSDDKLQRDGGEVHLLVGSDVASIHPEKIASIGELVIMKTVFGNGFTTMGHNVKHVKFEDTKAEFKVHVTAVENIREIACNVVTTKDIQFLEAISTESIGVNVAPKCRTCKDRSKKCRECSMITNNKTYLEHLQDIQIDQNIEKIKDGPGYIASYPYNSELSKLLPNEAVCKKRAETLEVKLKKSPNDLETINKEVQKSFENGAFRFLTPEEINDWDGPVHHLAMNVSYKDSETTPARLCFDAGQPDKNGRTLNDCMSKGSNPINHFGSVILNFRAAQDVACGDITKMFQQVAVRPLDMHVRRFHMRPDFFGGKGEWKIAVPTCVNFGETAAPSVATRVKNRCADDYRQISPKVADNIKRNCVMDDINVDCKYTENLDTNIKKAEEILANGKFSFKKWIRAGDKGEKRKNDLSKSLGLYWKTEIDVLTYRIRINFSKKHRNRYLGPDTSLETLRVDFPNPMTKRCALKLAHSVFDPANILQPLMLKQKLGYRDILIYERENESPGWDNPLPEKFREQWLKFTEEMFQLETLEFPRSLVPRKYDTNLKPTLCLFSDGSDLGQCVVAYLVWRLTDGSTHVSLVTSRTKIASMTKMSTPKSELCAAQLSSRLRTWLEQELDIEVGDVYHFVDASIIIGMLKNISLKFDTFTAPRVSEIQMNTPVEQWSWIQTFDNPADLGTRGKCSLSDLEPGTMWREGPRWLKDPKENWPIRSDFKKHEIPGLKKEFEILPPTVSNVTQLIQFSKALKDVEDNEKKEETAANTMNVESSYCIENIVEMVDVSKFSCWQKLCLAVKETLKAKHKWNKKVTCPDDVELMKQARMLLLRSMMPATKKMLEKTKLDGFIIHERDGLILAKTRTKNENLNPEDLIVLSPHHPITKLILTHIHNVNHRGVQYCVARSRIWYWIPQAAKLLKSIKNKCQMCKLKNAEAMSQLMAPIPEKRLKASPIWHFSMLDLFGPIEVTNFINQRTTRKTWAVIITCLTSRAIWVYLAEGFSTDDLLSVLRKHESRNGSPAEYSADLGKQIVGADRVMSEAVSDLNTKEIETFAAKRNVKFKFGTPYFPEGQGAVERLIKEVKSNLKVVTKRLLTFGELDTLLSECSYLVNCRPLQPNPTHGDEGFICANDLLFGRSDKDPPTVDIQDSSLTRKAAMKQKIIDEFWTKWSETYLQSLVQYQKWKHGSRNAEPGDLVLILDREIKKGKFTSAVVDSVKKDPDNVVRKVTVKYRTEQKCDAKQYKPSAFKYTERSVRGLALLVTAEDRKNSEKINIDEVRLCLDKYPKYEWDDDKKTVKWSQNSENNSNDDENNVGNEDNDVQEVDEAIVPESVKEKEIPKPNKNDSNKSKLKVLPSTSSGRVRHLPKKFN